MEGPFIKGKGERETLVIDLTNARIVSVEGEVISQLNAKTYQALDDLKAVIHQKIRDEYDY